MPLPEIKATLVAKVQVEKREIAKFLRDMATRYIRTPTNPANIQITPMNGKGFRIITENGRMLTYEPEALIFLEAAVVLEK